MDGFNISMFHHCPRVFNLKMMHSQLFKSLESNKVEIQQRDKCRYRSERYRQREEHVGLVPSSYLPEESQEFRRQRVILHETKNTG